MSDSPWENFSWKELECKCGCGGRKMDAHFMDRLQQLRSHLGFPLVLNSAYRCPDHNDDVSGTGRDGPHTTGRAVDIRISGEQAHKLLREAFEYGMSGVGVAQKGDHALRFVHLDDLEGQTRPWVWSY